MGRDEKYSGVWARLTSEERAERYLPIPLKSVEMLILSTNMSRSTLQVWVVQPETEAMELTWLLFGA